MAGMGRRSLALPRLRLRPMGLAIDLQLDSGVSKAHCTSPCDLRVLQLSHDDLASFVDKLVTRWRTWLHVAHGCP